MNLEEIEIRELTDVAEMNRCVELQREVFDDSDLELSPVRHFVIAAHSGGFTQAAFLGKRMIGFVLSLPMFRPNARGLYSHMTAVDKEFQSFGIGGKLKWAQRARALQDGIKFIRWTFQPVLARNAFFNLEKLGAEIRIYNPNYYGLSDVPNVGGKPDLIFETDRNYADWHLESEKVLANERGEIYVEKREVVEEIEVPADWFKYLETQPEEAIETAKKLKLKFEAAFAKGYVARSFIRDEHHPRYVLYKD